MRIAILGYGNIGRAAEQAIKAAPDMELAGIYHHNDCLDCIDADAVLICTPTREVQKFAAVLAARGICTVDSFDIHGQIWSLRSALNPVCKAHQAVSILSAGWDPGSDSMVRAILMALAPKGLTYTNFGPGRSMGHTVAAKAIKGVKNALSMTIPLGTGIHRRMVYIELEEGADFKTVEAAILNPALTGQVLVSCARAAIRLKERGDYGAKTMIELAPIDLLPGSTEQLVKTLV